MSHRRRPVSRWSVAARCVAAAVGGYALTYLVTAAIAVAMMAASPDDRSDAVLLSSEVSFIVWAVAIMACFYARTALRAWIGLVLAGVLPAIVVFALSP